MRGRVFECRPAACATSLSHHTHVLRDVGADTGVSKGYGFVEYVDDADSEAAYERMQGKALDGVPVLVDWERGRLMPGWRPRRLGGGLGGKKQSGQLRFGGRELPFHAPLDAVLAHAPDSSKRQRRGAGDQ